MKHVELYIFITYKLSYIGEVPFQSEMSTMAVELSAGYILLHCTTRHTTIPKASNTYSTHFHKKKKSKHPDNIV